MAHEVFEDPVGTPTIATAHRDGLTFRHRAGTVDELVLDDDYQGPRFDVSTATELPQVIVDAGAHIGAFALAAAAANPTARVIAVEAAAQTYDLLLTNINENRLANVEAVKVALSETDGTADLLHADWNWGHSLEPSLVAPGAAAETVRTMTLASLIDQLGLAEVSYLKMNIEGAEYSTLLAADAAVLRRIGRMAVELHPLASHTIDELAEHIGAAGFAVDVDREGADGETFLGWLRAVRRE